MWHWFSHWIIKQSFLRCFSDFHFEISQSACLTANIMLVNVDRFSMWGIPVLLKYTFFIGKIYKICHLNICSVYICWMDIRQSVFSIHKVAKLSKKFFSHSIYIRTVSSLLIWLKLVYGQFQEARKDWNVPKKKPIPEEAIPKRAHSRRNKFHKGHIPKRAHSKKSTFWKGHIPKRAHSKKSTFQK